MSDNLRDRIADTIESAGLQWDTEFNAWMLGRPNSADPGPQPPRIAQAIIDEFGMTVEERLTEFGIDDPGHQERVVGKWEESDEQEPRP